MGVGQRQRGKSLKKAFVKPAAKEKWEPPTADALHLRDSAGPQPTGPPSEAASSRAGQVKTVATEKELVERALRAVGRLCSAGVGREQFPKVSHDNKCCLL